MAVREFIPGEIYGYKTVDYEPALILAIVREYSTQVGLVEAIAFIEGQVLHVTLDRCKRVKVE
jgi:hypothetical protein